MDDELVLGAHRLGPDVVGQRVVIRRLVPGETGPTGGPAFTDLLGICESWTETSTTIRTEDGTRVEIPLALIVSGKPVPPRASIRHRVGVREAEGHAGVLWPGILREPLGDWELRWQPDDGERLRKRTNSALAIGDPGIAWTEAVDVVLDFYRDRGRPAMVQVERGSAAEQALTDAGWAPLTGDVRFLLGSVSRVLRRLQHPTTPVDLSEDGDRITASTADGSAIVRAGVDGDWVGLHDLWVAPASRRQGLARAVLAAALDAAAAHGALHAWLHVEEDNLPAIALYEELGFVEHHRCRYLAAPVAASATDRGR